MFPKSRTNTRKVRACPASEGGSGARTGNNVVVESRPTPIEYGMGLIKKNEPHG